MRLFTAATLILAALVSPASALACGSCASGWVDSWLPPVVGWTFVAGSWCFASVGIAAWRPVPRRIRFLLVTCALALLATLALPFLGFGVGLLLFLPPAWLLRRAMGGPERIEDAKGRRAVRVLAAPALVAVAVTAAWCVHVHRTRTRGELIVQWGGGGLAWHWLRDLEAEGAASLDDARHVVRHGKDFTAARAAGHVARFGDASDIALLEQAQRRAEAEGWTRFQRDELTEAKATLEARLKEGDAT